MATKTTRAIKKRLYYQCEDCKVRRFVTWVEFNRASRPICYACGSTHLELVSEDAVTDRRVT